MDIKLCFKNAYKKTARAGSAVVAGTLGLIGSVRAAVPTEASDAVTALVTDATAFVGSLWLVVVPVTMGFLFIRLFKKGSNKSV